MLKEIQTVISRAETTIWKDFAGGMALIVMLVGGLYIPGLA